MAMVVVGLMQDAHQARGVVRALEGAGFDLEDIDTSGTLVDELMLLGVSDEDAHFFAEGARRGGMIVCARAGDPRMAEQAADIMDEHGAIDVDACSTGWRGKGWSGQVGTPVKTTVLAHYAIEFGEYPAGPGRIYRDARSYSGPERRHDALPFFGVNRRGPRLKHSGATPAR
ncbi:MAG: hypothetical protein ACT4P4_22780 [Betaproteobacteria bacterium]